jgi:hypothetical protein
MIEKVFISNNNTATFICPECDKARTADVSEYLGASVEIRIKCRCKCGHTFTAVLERRKYFRKDMNIPGMFISGIKDKRDYMTVVDLSRSGCKIKLTDKHVYTIGDQLLLEFNLDNSEQSLIRKVATVKSCSEYFIGAEFNTIEHYDKIGHYLMFS